MSRFFTAKENYIWPDRAALVWPYKYFMVSFPLPGKADTHNGLDTTDWKVGIDKGPYMENYKDIPELPNAEPNWNDAQSMNSKGVPENADGTPDIAPEDDPNAGTNQQVAQQFRKRQLFQLLPIYDTLKQQFSKEMATI